MKKLFLLLAVLAPLAFMSCSEDVTAPTKGTFLPTNTGTWWEMETNATDSLGNKEGISSSSTITVGSTYDFNGRKATQFIDISEGVEPDTTLMSVDGQIVYIDGTEFNQFGNFFSEFLGGGTAPDINLNLTWVKIADPNTPSWEVTKVDIPEMDVSQFLGGQIKAYLNGNIKITGSQAGIEDIVIKGKTYAASAFNMNIEFAGKVNTTIVFAKIDLASINVIIGQKFYFVEGIGLVKSVNTGQTFELKRLNPALPIPEQKSKTGGSISTVIDFNIK